MMIDQTRMKLEWAMRNSTSAMSSALDAASGLAGLIELRPEWRDQLAGTMAQLYALADVARDVERDLARLHGKHRAAVTP